MRTILALFTITASLAVTATALPQSSTPPDPAQRHEWYDMPPAVPASATGPAGGFTYRDAISFQVNVNADGLNIKGDAGNEPSIVVDPFHPWRMAIGWRQFASIESSFREAGVAYTRDAGRTWINNGPLKPGEFRTDPVLDADTFGNFYYYSLYGQDLTNCDMFKSTDGGRTWAEPVEAGGGDKNWMIVDRTDSIGQDNIYGNWRESFSCCGKNVFVRSTDLGETYDDLAPITTSPELGTMAIGPDGEVYVFGNKLNNRSAFRVAKSESARDPDKTIKFETGVDVTMGGTVGFFSGGPNPDGLWGQGWIAVDRSNSDRRGWVYLLWSLDPSGADPCDVRFARSEDGGKTWKTAIRVNDDPSNKNAYQWFGTMSVAPNGRIDAIWNDTRDDQKPSTPQTSRLYYSSSSDGGVTWSKNEPLTDAWGHFKGYPQQRKIGDYYHMVSDNIGANLAYAATFNDEQDIYFMRIGPFDCNGNGVNDDDDIASGDATDLNGNGIPDICDELGDLDCNFAVDFNDIDPFVTALVSQSDYESAYPYCDYIHGDTDGDGSVNFADIDGFVALLVR